jgi:energy-coupling factor transport system substrate-specific component
MPSGVQRELTGRAFGARTALVLIAVALNIAINFVDRRAGLPLFLGRFGTVLAGALGGPWAGGLAGALSNAVYGLAIHSESMPYAIVNLAIGVSAGLTARWFARPGPTLLAAFVVTFVGTVASAAVGTVVYGMTGNGAHPLTAFFFMTARSLRHYVVGPEFLMDAADKVATCYLVFCVIRALPPGARVRFGAA